ncbi:MAG: rhamnulose-1-phosphate aldolase, partial [Prevotella sp.]|nr:rhamnulose-1-phosphate aldolase [Prevotella sp.]
MKSILEGRPGLEAVINQIAEVTGYLWQKGWAERNGGNITVNIT